MPKLSIIVPVYNTEKQIEKCLKSIINQKSEDIEAVIINDGSSDASEDIILKYVNDNPSLFRYYKKENTGIADTRNFGIEEATGEYILFVDSDDYINDNLVQNLKEYILRNIDVIKFKASIVDKNEVIVDGPVFEETNGETAFNLLAFDDVLFDSPCVYLFKKELFKNNNFKFQVGTYHEDFGLIPLLVLTAKTVISTNIIGYNYIQTENSITRNNNYEKDIKRFQDTLLHYDNMLKYISRININIKTKENVKIYYTNAVLLKLRAIKKQDRKQYIKEIQKRNMISNIKVRNIKQLIKRIILSININWYLKLIK